MGTPSSTTWTNRTAPTAATWQDRREFLLQQDGFFLLQENGDKILITGVGATTWTPR